MTYPYQQPRSGVPTWVKVLMVIGVLLVALVGCGACTAALVATPSTSTSYPTPQPVTSALGGTTTPSPPTTTTVEVQEWGQGTWIVGEDIQPGKYKTEGADGALFAFCMATRESDSGAMIDMESTNEGPAYITVRASDGQLSLSGPCVWTKVAA